MKYGNLDNRERKFISTNIAYLNKYLEHLKLLEEVTIIQTFDQEYKYRKYITKNKTCHYTKNLKNGHITQVIKIDKKEFEKVINKTEKWIKKRRRIYKQGLYQIDVDDFEIPNTFTMIEVFGNKSDLFDTPKGWIEVTNVKEYQNKNIYHGSIHKTNIIIEGTDGIGKSETIKRLLLQGIICKDRDSSVISSNMLFEIPMETRAKKYFQFFKTNDDIVIFLINNDKQELLRRVLSRKQISDFDLDTCEYNKLYKETYEYMKQKNMLERKLYMVDCTGLNIEEQVKAVKKVIDKYA